MVKQYASNYLGAPLPEFSSSSRRSEADRLSTVSAAAISTTKLSPPPRLWLAYIAGAAAEVERKLELRTSTDCLSQRYHLGGFISGKSSSFLRVSLHSMDRRCKECRQNRSIIAISMSSQPKILLDTGKTIEKLFFDKNK